LHNHSTWSDGHQLPSAICQHHAGTGAGLLGDHRSFESSFQAKGLDTARVREQLKEIKKINQRLADEGAEFRLLTGSEVDILTDGRLDFPDDLLQNWTSSSRAFTRVFTRAKRRPRNDLLARRRIGTCTCWGNLTGRLLLEREPYKVDQRAVIDACAATGTWIETQCQPVSVRPGLATLAVRESKGVKCVINCDAHRAEHADFLRLGAGIAAKDG